MKNKEQTIRSLVDHIYPVSKQSFQKLASCFYYRTLPKEEVFIKRNRPNNYEYFILSGLCRSFLLNPDGEEMTIQFFQSPAVISPHITRTRKEVSLLNYQSLTQVEIVYFSQQDLVDLMIQNLEIRFFANTVLQNELLQKVNKEIGLASLTAKERLLRFREDFDGLENLIPHPMIASYLGITNISLSRLRRELSQEK